MKPSPKTESGLRTDDGGFKPNMWVDISGGFLDKKTRDYGYLLIGNR
jgi:hypothetical protein